MSSQNGYRGVYLKQIFCVKGKAVSMKKLVAVLTVIIVLTGCVYDPVNYNKIHDALIALQSIISVDVSVKAL